MRHDRTARRYELLVQGRRIGELRYRIEAGAVALVHTEVEPAHRNRGHASALVEAALRDLREQRQRVVPVCPFVRAYIGRHPEHADLVSGTTP